VPEKWERNARVEQIGRVPLVSRLVVPSDPEAAYTIARIDEEGIADVLAVWNECATWLTERGIVQWTPGDLTAERVRALVAKTADEEWYVVRHGGDLAGTFLLRWEDPDTWGEQSADAGYVHALCVRRAYAGRALGRAMLDWASQRVGERGRQWLRLDCLTANPVLVAYYTAAGFTALRPSTARWVGSTLFQRAV
jgi:ribosomal protein S18 acetylase RimI-like enzyme